MAESIESKERPPYLFNIYDQLNDASSQSGISAVEISLKSGFNTNISIRYVTLQPGARISGLWRFWGVIWLYRNEMKFQNHLLILCKTLSSLACLGLA